MEVLVWAVVKEAWLLILMRFSKCSWANKWVVVAVEVIHSLVSWAEEDGEEAHEDEGVVEILSLVLVRVIPLLASTKVQVDEEDEAVGEAAQPFSSICELSSIYNFL